MTENAQNADFRRKPKIFADSAKESFWTFATLVAQGACLEESLLALKLSMVAELRFWGGFLVFPLLFALLA